MAAALIGAGVNAALQGFRISAGRQDRFNWGELAGAAFAGAITFGFAAQAPGFEGASLMAKYTGKALYAAGTAGAASLTQQLIEEGTNAALFNIQSTKEPGEYWKNAGIAAAFGFGISASFSAYDFVSWGKELETGQINNYNAQLDLSKYKSGLYFVSIKSQSYSQTDRVILQ